MLDIIEHILGLDFIIFALTFVLIWLVVLIHSEKYSAITFGCLGIFLSFIVDYFFWFQFYNIRTYSGPISAVLFFLYSSITYGTVQYSYVILMFNAKENMERIK